MSQALATHIDEIIESSVLAPRNGFHLEPRCRVCRNDDLRRKVNDLLATGSSYRMIVRALGEDNAKLDERERVTIDSVRNHTTRHFPVQNVALATYRQILERRAQENQIDFVEGVATALTPLAFLETVMLKSYETLVDSNTKVDVQTGMVAASRLQSLIESRDNSIDIAEMKAQLGRIIDAVHAVVPEAMWGEIVEELEQQPASLDFGADADDDASDPTEFIHEDEEF